jgi:hypothetical protein
LHSGSTVSRRESVQCRPQFPPFIHPAACSAGNSRRRTSPPFTPRSSSLAIMPRNFGDEQWLNTDDRKGAVQAMIGAAELIRAPKRKNSESGRGGQRSTVDRAWIGEQTSNKPLLPAIRCAFIACHNVTRSIRVGSSSAALELLTRFEIGNFCRRLSAAGLRNSRPAFPLGHGS